MVKVLLIEDELPAAKRLSKLILEAAPDFEIVQICDSIESSVHYLTTSPLPDLIFLDVQLSDGLSFEIFRQVEISCPVIFTTAYDEYVFRAFELNSIDYLMKPIHSDALDRSIDKFRKISQTPPPDWSFITNLFNKDSSHYKQRFLVNVGSNLMSIPTPQIAYFYSIERSTFLVHQSGKSFALDYSLDKLESILPPTDFFRVNRQFLITPASIQKIVILSKSRMKVVLNPVFNEDVFVSNARTHEFRRWLDR